MSYLLPAGTSPRTKNKWGLGAYRTRFPRTRGVSGLGQEAITMTPLTPCDQPDPNNPGVPAASRQFFKEPIRRDVLHFSGGGRSNEWHRMHVLRRHDGKSVGGCGQNLHDIDYPS